MPLTARVPPEMELEVVLMRSGPVESKAVEVRREKALLRVRVPPEAPLRVPETLTGSLMTPPPVIFLVAGMVMGEPLMVVMPLGLEKLAKEDAEEADIARNKLSELRKGGQ